MSNMHTVHLRDIDLNLLRLLEALLRRGALAAAAQELGLSQSAASHALARLRSALGDPLFVRGHGGWGPTERARGLAEPLREAFEQIDQALTPPAPFEPATSKERFTLLMEDYSELVLLPELAGRLSQTAPGVSLWVRGGAAKHQLAEALDAADVAVAPSPSGDGWPGLRGRRLCDERFVCLVRAGHPALACPWTPESFAKLRHAFIAPRGTPGGIVDTALGALGLTRQVAVAVPHFLVAPFVVAKSDLVLTLPERVAHTFSASLPVEVVEPPISLPGFSLDLLWHERLHHTPRHAWLREQLAAVASALPTAGATPANATVAGATVA